MRDELVGNRIMRRFFAEQKSAGARPKTFQMRGDGEACDQGVVTYSAGANIAGNKAAESFRACSKGFSTLELMIAFAIMMIVLVGAVSANFGAQYWTITSETSNEALYKAKTKLEDSRALAKQDFYQVIPVPLAVDTDPVCAAGGLCYSSETLVTDLSSCSKYVQSKIQWQIRGGYPLSVISLSTNLTNAEEAIALGGDCILNQPAGQWQSNPTQLVGTITYAPGKFFTGLDVFHNKIYATTAVSPYFVVFNVPASVGSNPTLSGSTAGFGVKLNALDVTEDLSTGRSYAFVAQDSATYQLGVIDVTDPTNPVLTTKRKLLGVSATGSYPQGWRVRAYGNRLYVTSRETLGNEFHIFDITIPTQPSEIGGGFELTRTVEDIVVHDQKISGVAHRIVYLATDSDSKELSVLDVTGDIITELSAVDLNGSSDGASLALLGNNLYLGWLQNSGGPELYVFDVTDPSVIQSHVLGRAEVGADVFSLRASGSFVYAGTSKSGQEFQVWSSDYSTWNPAVLNAGRFSGFSFSNLAPLGLDIENDWLYGVSQAGVSDGIRVLYAP